MSWIVLHTDLRHHRKLACLSDDAARWGWIVTLMEAKRQSRPGVFASTEHLAYVLGEDLAQYIEEYVNAKLIERKRNGSLLVHDWSDYQRDPTGAVRQARYRDRHRNVTGNEKVTATRARTRPVAVHVPVVVLSEGVQGEPDALDIVIRWLASRKVSVASGSRIETDLARLVDQHGADTVIATMTGLPGLHDSAQYVYGTRNVLNPIPSGKQVVVASQAEDAKVRADLRTEQIQRGMWERRLERFRNTGEWDEAWGPAPESVAS